MRQLRLELSSVFLWHSSMECRAVGWRCCWVACHMNCVVCFLWQPSMECRAVGSRCCWVACHMNCVVCSCDSQVWNAGQSAQAAAELLAVWTVWCVLVTAKYGMPSSRLKMLLSCLPYARRLGLLHYEMTRTRTVSAEEVAIKSSAGAGATAVPGTSEPDWVCRH